MTDPNAIKSDRAGSSAPRPRRRWTRFLLWLVIFVSGLVVGAGLTLTVVRQGLLRAIHHPQAMPAEITQRLRRPLKLNDEQAQRILAILVERQHALQQIRTRVQPEVQAELDLVDRQVAEVLDPGQRETWRRLYNHLRDTWIPVVPQVKIRPAAPPPTATP